MRCRTRPWRSDVRDKVESRALWRFHLDGALADLGAVDVERPLAGVAVLLLVLELDFVLAGCQGLAGPDGEVPRPAKNFWSFLVYDDQTRSMLQTDEQFPSIGSQKKGIVVSAGRRVAAA